MKKIKTQQKIALLIILTALLSFSAAAVSKPIGSRIIGQTGPVDFFVEVDFLGNPERCIVVPPIQTGSDGSFATNLANLVFEDFPETKCSGYWQVGDKIWYEFNGQQSQMETVQSGTGLQLLPELNLASAETPASSGGSGGGSGSAVAQPEEQPTETEKPKISTSVSLVNEIDKVRANVLVNLLNGQSAYIDIRVVLSETINNQPVKIITDRIFIRNSFEKTYALDMSDYQALPYQVQIFVYFEDELISKSNLEKFSTIVPPPAELEQLPLPLVEQREFSLLSLQIALVVLFTFLLGYLIYSLKTKKP